MKLFTGMVAFVPTMGAKNWWQLPVCFVCNALGMAAMAVLLRFSFLGDTIAAQAAYTIGVKLEDKLWYVKDFCSAVLCGMLITFSVRALFLFCLWWKERKERTGEEKADKEE